MGEDSFMNFSLSIYITSTHSLWIVGTNTERINILVQFATHSHCITNRFKRLGIFQLRGKHTIVLVNNTIVITNDIDNITHIVHSFNR